MAIPGLKPKLDIRGKVRIGETRVSKTGKSYPAATDYFVSDDAEFRKMYDKPKTIRIIPAYSDPAEFFSTGLEWWIKDKNKNPLLACYTKGDGTALRMEGMKDPENEVLGPIRGNNKLPIKCAFRECRQFKARNCRPMARLTFFLEWGNAGRGALQLDTKSWNSIEALEGTLGSYADVRGKVFELSVRIESQGDKRFPVLSLKEADVKINTESDVTEADALVTLSNDQTREGLAQYLDAARPGWRDDERYVARIQEIGVEAAIAKTLERMGS